MDSLQGAGDAITAGVIVAIIGAVGLIIGNIIGQVLGPLAHELLKRRLDSNSARREERRVAVTALQRRAADIAEAFALEQDDEARRLRASFMPLIHSLNLHAGPGVNLKIRNAIFAAVLERPNEAPLQGWSQNTISMQILDVLVDRPKKWDAVAEALGEASRRRAPLIPD